MIRRWFRALRSFALSFSFLHTPRVMESLLLEAHRMRAAGVVHTRAEWDSLAPIERAALVVADDGEAEQPSLPPQAALSRAADQVLARMGTVPS